MADDGPIRAGRQSREGGRADQTARRAEIVREKQLLANLADNSKRGKSRWNKKFRLKIVLAKSAKTKTGGFRNKKFQN
jgi:hypothetical protein